LQYAVAEPGTRPFWPRLATLLGKRLNSSAARSVARGPALIIGRVIPPSVTPWSQCDPRLLHGVRGVLTDIDDTLTTDGQIPMGVVAALAALQAAGLPVIAVTGRPLGWSREVALPTPLAAIVAENGAVALWREDDEVRIEFADPEPVRDANAARLRAVAARIVAEVPGATLSRDSTGRITDIAIDHGEFAHLDPAQIDRVLALMRRAGMNATVSSIHVNGWFGTHTKLTGATWIVRRLLARDLDAGRDAWLYVGDSTNDEPMFAAFPLSVGVANIVDFADRLRRWPAYVTALDRGRGFVEIAEALLAARGA
jgi:HAD superfamily hydrolase (TIGR01484 family)